MILNGKTYLPVAEVMKITGITRPTLKKYLDHGIIKGLRIGCKRWIDAATLEQTVNVL